jgi:hypothetical protein
MLVPPSTRPERGRSWLVLTVCLLAVLVSSSDLPSRPDRVGPAVLGAKLRWTVAWTSLHWLGLLPSPSAGLLVRLDPELRSGRAREAARWLAGHASDPERIRWAAALAARSPGDVGLLRRVVRAALDTGRCDLLRAVIAAGSSLPVGSAARTATADELAAPQTATRWGRAATDAGRRLSGTDRPDGTTTRRSAPGPGNDAHRTRSSPCVA